MFRKIHAGLSANAAALLALNDRIETMSTAFDNLTAAVNAQISVDAAAATLISGIATQLKATSDDAAIQSLADQLTAAAAPLSAAVAANTPAASAAPTADPTDSSAPAPDPAASSEQASS